VATLSDLMIRIGVDTSKVKQGVTKTTAALEKGFSKLDNVAGSAVKTMSAVSGVVPLAAGAAGGVLALATSFAAAGAAAGVFGAVLGSTVSEVSENATKYEDLSEKIRLYGRSAELANKYGQDAEKILDKQAKAMLELEARLSLLPPAERKATMAFIGMKNSWSDFVDDNKPATFAFLERGYGLIGKVVGKLQPLFDIGARAANRLVTKLYSVVNGGFFERLADRAGPAMTSVMDIIINLGKVFAGVFGKMGDAQGQGMLDWLSKATARWAEWASATEQDTGINRFVSYMTDNGPKLVELLGNLATAAVNIAKALSPLAPITAAVALALSSIVAAVPPDFITTLVAGVLAYSAALKLWAAYQAIATAAQWAHNVALFAWPGTWIIAGIIALVAVLVLIATKTRWFQQAWEATWNFLKAVGAWFAGPFANFFVKAWQAVWDWMKGIGAWFAGPFAAFFVNAWNGVLNFFRRVGAWFAGPFANFFVTLYGKITGGLTNAYNWVTRKWNNMIAFLQNVKTRAVSALAGIWDGLKSGFRSAVNWIISKWNNISFSIPSINVFGQTLGGGTIDLPNIPQLARGGIVKARSGGTLVNVGEGGQDEAVVPLSRMPDVAQGRSDRPVVIQIVPGGEQEFRRWINRSIRVKGALG
jgi:hypothetical protein